MTTTIRCTGEPMPPEIQAKVREQIAAGKIVRRVRDYSDVDWLPNSCRTASMVSVTEWHLISDDPQAQQTGALEYLSSSVKIGRKRSGGIGPCVSAVVAADAGRPGSWRQI